MWKDYSSSYIKNNRSSGAAVIIATFISALLLSLLCCLFYNAWKYEVERIELEEGSWQSRITLELSSEDIQTIQNFAHIKDVVISENEKEGACVDLYFSDYKYVLEDTPKIAESLGCSTDAVSYHYALLAMYLIRGEKDSAPRLLLPLFLFITILASFSLIVIIHNSFAVSMNARIHQFGIFSSIGATPKQIKTCLLQEAAVLSAIPVLMGNFLGILLSIGLIKMTNDVFGSDVVGRHESIFGYHPLVFLITFVVTVITILISAWLPARKLSKLTPLEAIRNNGELHLKRRKRAPFLKLLFGVEGELAGNALKAQRKSLRTASLSLVLSFMAFTIMQCFFTSAEISTKETYFERYQNVWDVMVTIKNTDIDLIGDIEDIQGLSNARSAIMYQKAQAKVIITEDEVSDDMKSFGGFSQASANYVQKTEDGWLVNSPIIIMDDDSFLGFCEQIGITPQLDGAIILNQIRDVTNPDFRHPEYMPYVKGDKNTSTLRQSGNVEMLAEIPVLSYTDKTPVLREEYATIDYYELVHFIPVTLWMKMKGQIAGSENDTYICALGREAVTLEELTALQKEITQCLGGNYYIESENRIQEQEVNAKQIQGMMALFGGFCVLLAVIGIGNVFSNTLGFVRQRKREFARYMSVGLTPEEIRKMFCVEAIVIAGRPILITLPVAAIIVGLMLKASYLNVGEFLGEAPLIPIVIFMASIIGTVAFAYYLGWRNVRKISLAEVLRDDTMM